MQKQISATAVTPRHMLYVEQMICQLQEALPTFDITYEVGKSKNGCIALKHHDLKITVITSDIDTEFYDSVGTACLPEHEGRKCLIQVLGFFKLERLKWKAETRVDLMLVIWYNMPDYLKRYFRHFFK